MKNKNVVIKQSIIPELVSGSSTQSVTQQQALKTLKKFQGLSNFTTVRGFPARSVTPTLRAAIYAGYSGRKGFTLIELLVVVLIIGILAAVALPQYQKAVMKSRFAEVLVNLQAIGQADQACRLNGKEACGMDELDIEIGELNWSDGCGTPAEHTAVVGDFIYCASDSFENIAMAQYDKEDVCLCRLDTGEIVINQDEQLCRDTKPSYDYAKLLNLREVGAGICGCC